MKEFLPILRSSPLFAGISDGEILQTLEIFGAKIKNFKKDEFILRAGEPVEGVGVLLSGSGLILREDFWGNRNILASVGVADCFGEAFACSGGAESNVGVIACEECRALFVSVKRLLCDSGCHRPACGRMIKNLLAELAAKNLRLNEKITHLEQRSTRAKLLSYLSSQAQRSGSAEFDIPFTRLQMADYLSVERSGLSQELGKMQSEGLIEFKRNHFILKTQQTTV